jgi:hypothetical protein
VVFLVEPSRAFAQAFGQLLEHGERSFLVTLARRSP